MCTARQKLLVINVVVLVTVVLVPSTIQSQLAMWRREQGDKKIVFPTYRKSEDIS